MAYIALYRKWRPKSFEDVVGQSHITKTLQKAIATDKVAHAYLFSGPRGTGKTSTAKIFARAMNCVHGPTPHPCNECEVCRHIISGESLDVVEIDAASNRSIEDIRTLRETIKFMPAEGHKKIYIIDEVHMLTTEAFNALLKTLEEPPSHVIFILATTEPERIPMTILSRCQRYEFRRITSQDIAKRLLYVAGQEKIDLTKGAAHILAVQADGGMRDALSMLDQCISNTQGTIDEKVVRDLLGLIGKDWLFSLADAVFTGQGSVIIKDVDEVVRMGKEPRVILTELLGHLRALMLCQADAASDTLSAYDDCLDELKKQAGAVSPEQVFTVLGTLQEALLTAKTSPVPRIAVEMGLLMAARQLTQPVAAAAAAVQKAPAPQPAAPKKRPAAVEAVPLPEEEYSTAALPEEYVPLPEEEYAPPAPAAPVYTAPAAPVQTAAPEPAAAAASPMPAAPAPAAPAQPKPAAATPAASAAAATANTSVPAAAASISPVQYADIWQKMCAILHKEKKKSLYSCVRNGQIVHIGQGLVIARLLTPFMAKMANREINTKYTDAALSSLLGGAYHLRCYPKGDPEVAEYVKKDQSSAPVAPKAAAPVTAPPAEMPVPAAMVPEETEPLPQESVPAAAPDPLSPDAASLSAANWQPASVQDMDESERAAIAPLLKNVGDCNIYIENK